MAATFHTTAIADSQRAIAGSEHHDKRHRHNAALGRPPRGASHNLRQPHNTRGRRANGLGLCRQAAADEGLCIETLELDLEQAPLPAGPFVAISCFHYLQRDLFPSLRERLAPPGLLICELPTRRNLERNARPSARFLVEEGELRELCAPLELLHFEEGWVGDRALARALARRGPDR